MDNTMEEEDVSGEVKVEHFGDPFTAEFYAAEAMASDMDPWIKFDSRKTPRAEFDSWLESNKPSQVKRYGHEDGHRGPVGWISVLGPDIGPSAEDVTSLLESWECLLASGRTVSFQSVKELALNHNVPSGKWLMYLDSGFKVDHAWECVARATLEGKIYCVKVTPNDPTSGSKHVICVYNQNFTDENQVVRLDAVIRAAGVKCPLSYKPDVYSYLGIYRKNRWNMCPTIYESKFHLECVPRRSHIFNKVSNLKVT